MGNYQAIAKRQCRPAAGLRGPISAAILLAAGTMLAGCGGSSLGGSLPNWFASAGGSTAAAPGSAAAPVSVSDDCPTVDVRSGASTLAIATNVQSPTANDVRYQLSFHEFARQCFLDGGSMRMRVGVQGRAVVGPAGAPPEISIPIRFAVVREGVTPRTIVTKFRRTSAPLPPGSGSIPFTDIEEDLSFPLPPLAELQSYIVYVGFDDLGDRNERRPPAKKKAPPRKN